MKNLSRLCLIFMAFFLASATAAQAQVLPASDLSLTATTSATESASLSASLATPSANIEQRIQERKDNDITETSGRQKDKFEAFLDENPVAPLSWNNFIEHAIRDSVKRGVPANILVLVVLFPLIASFIAASRHVIGLRGFGIYIPAVLSVALVSTGPVVGILIFGAIVSVALLSKKILKPTKLPYLPRTALLLWLISLTVLGVIMIAPFINVTNLMTLNIFPILILVLLSENFLDAQANSKPSDAVALAMETLGLAIVSSLLLRLDYLQKIALLEPELILVGTAALNLVVGRFVGLRLTEWLRFRPIIEE